MTQSPDKKEEESSGHKFERQRRDLPQQSSPQRAVAPANENKDMPFELNDPLHFNELSTNIQHASQQILVQQLRLVSQQQFLPPQLDAASISNGVETLHKHQNANIATMHPPQIGNIGIMLRTGLWPPEQSAHYQAPLTASGHYTETSVAVGKSPELSLSPPKPVKPKRPLSAYNIFFQEERTKIIGERECTGRKDTPTNLPIHKKQRYQPNGTGFEDLAKEISKRWKTIDSERLAECSRLAEADTERYQNELAVYHDLREKNLSAKQQAQEASVSEETWKEYLTAAEKQKPSRKRQKKGDQTITKHGP